MMGVAMLYLIHTIAGSFNRIYSQWGDPILEGLCKVLYKEHHIEYGSMNYVDY